MPARKRKKQTRDADGSVYKRTETRMVNGRSKKVVQWYARVRYTDETGLLREKKRRATSQADAVERRRTLREEIKTDNATARRPVEEKTFAEMAKWYEEKYLVAPRYISDRKVAGLESWRRERNFVKRLVGFFGDDLAPAITYDRLEQYKEWRLAAASGRIGLVRSKATKMGKGLSPRFLQQTNLIAVDRELQRLRAMLNKLVQKGWIAVNPFAQGDPLISVSQEDYRERILQRNEETRLLAHCEGKRGHLYTAIVFAIDTGMRETEQTRLTWQGVDWLHQVIRLKSSNTKGKRSRVVPITSRLRPLLLDLYEHSDKRVDTRIFPFASFRRSFGTAARLAGIEDLLWRDLRATGITWMLDAGVEPAKVMKIVGHTNYKTFLRYVRLSEELAREAGEKMDSRRAELELAGKFASPQALPLSG
jgi:site-specific recombinase XerD